MSRPPGGNVRVSLHSILDRWVCIGLLLVACSAAEEPAAPSPEPPAPAATAGAAAPRLLLL
jgi:hypothetical protein